MLAALALEVAVLAVLIPGYTCNHTFRLPRDVMPKEYNLRILTDLEDFTFQGQVDILVECKTMTRNIILHAKDLNIVEANVTVQSLEGITNRVTSQGSQKYDLYRLQLAEPLQVGHSYNVRIPFHGKLSEGLAGYYRSSYVKRSSKKNKWLSVTQFESTDARTAFPCFDEPEFKAQFRVILGHHKDLTGVSNMPLNYTEAMEGRKNWVWDHFMLSERMSTYLLAFIVSDLEYITSPPSAHNNVTFRIWARHDAIAQTKLAGEIGPKVLRFYEEYFDVPYPLPKQDMAAIPDFSSGAMENWGLITYREKALLYDDEMSTKSNKKVIAGVIAHELAHQWFGNLVTMKWWTDLWLNEGFATYVATVGVHKLFPEWKSDEIDAVSGLLTVFEFDALKSSHPVFVDIDQPNKIEQVFDAISYKKGAYLLRMMNMFLGENVFRRGVSQYLKAHKFANAEQNDLWNSLTRAAHDRNMLPENMNVKQIMDTWTLQTGYPVINVIRDYETGTAKISQNRYLSYKLNDSEPKSTDCWVLPITYTTQVEADFKDTSPKSWFLCNNSDTGTPEHQISKLPTADQWVILNINILGLFRVNYDDKNWELISRTLNSDRFTSIGLLNRVQLVLDSMDLAWTGALDYTNALRLVNYLNRETEYLPWKAGFSNLNKLSTMLRRTEAYSHFRNYMRNLLTPIYNKVENISRASAEQDLQQIKLQNAVVNWACNLQLGNCEEEARQLFNKWRNTTNPDNENPIQLNLRSTIYCTAIKYGGEKEWTFIWERYLASNVASEKITLLDTLSCTRERWLLSRLLQWSLTETKGIRKQDMGYVFYGVAANDVGYDLAREFLMDQIGRIHEYLGSKAGRIGGYVKAIAKRIYTQRQYDQLAQFVKENEKYLNRATLSVQQALEKAQSNIHWHKNYYDSLLKTIASF